MQSAICRTEDAVSSTDAAITVEGYAYSGGGRAINRVVRFDLLRPSSSFRRLLSLVHHSFGWRSLTQSPSLRSPPEECASVPRLVTVASLRPLFLLRMQEVSADGGETWTQAELKEGADQPRHKAWAWTLWEVSG